jgi:ATP10 protein
VKIGAVKMACRFALLALIAAGIAVAQPLQPGSTLPQIKGTSLEDRDVTLPEAAAGKAALLIITFSKAAGEHGRAWNDRFIQDYPQDDKATSYSIAMLEDVPGLFRGMVRSGIKRSIPAALRRRFITVVKDEAQWKQYIGMKEEKDPYLLLLDTSGRVSWKHQGSFDQKIYDTLKTKITELIKPSSKGQGR